MSERQEHRRRMYCHYRARVAAWKKAEPPRWRWIRHRKWLAAKPEKPRD